MTSPGKVCRVCRCDTYTYTESFAVTSYSCCGCSILFEHVVDMFIDPLDLPRLEPSIREVMQLKDAIDEEIKRKKKL